MTTDNGWQYQKIYYKTDFGWMAKKRKSTA